MTKELIVMVFPTLQVVSCFGAFCAYAYFGEWRQAAYWFFATGLTAVVAYLLK